MLLGNNAQCILFWKHDRHCGPQFLVLFKLVDKYVRLIKWWINTTGYARIHPLSPHHYRSTAYKVFHIQVRPPCQEPVVGLIIVAWTESLSKLLLKDTGVTTSVQFCSHNGALTSLLSQPKPWDLCDEAYLQPWLLVHVTRCSLLVMINAHQHWHWVLPLSLDLWIGIVAQM